VAQQVAQTTREKVWQKMPTFEPSHGGFQAFAKYWAGIMLLRYYNAQRQQHKVETLFSELQGRYPTLERVMHLCIGDSYEWT
jgi:hypothetical protein